MKHKATNIEYFRIVLIAIPRRELKEGIEKYLPFSLEYPFFVKIMDYFEYDGEMYLITEQFSEDDLYSKMKGLKDERIGLSCDVSFLFFLSLHFSSLFFTFLVFLLFLFRFSSNIASTLPKSFLSSILIPFLDSILSPTSSLYQQMVISNIV
jgi:hypothetical protein